MVVARCPSHHLGSPYSDSLPVGLPVEEHDVEGWSALCIYALVWDNPREPWLAEHALFPYDMVGANEEELSEPSFSRYRLAASILPLVSGSSFVDAGG